MCPVKKQLNRVYVRWEKCISGLHRDMTRAGEGVTYALKNCSVLVVGALGRISGWNHRYEREGQKYTLLVN